jgi:hypothetical protein
MVAEKRKTIWVQHVDVTARALQIRLNVAKAHKLGPEQQAVVEGIEDLIGRARSAADRKDPVPSRLINWWRGVLVEAAYRNMHAARAQLVDLYSKADIDAEIPGAVARVHSALGPGDPRCITQNQLRGLPDDRQRAWLRRLVEDGYEATDLKHAQLRNFRNTLFKLTAVITLLVILTVIAVSFRPTVMPLCFPHEVINAGTTTARQLNCPTRSNTAGPSGGDVCVVGLLGLLGGTLAASIAIRNIRGTSTPYDVPVALAWLKVPLGAFTAIVGIVAIHGGFVPGLSVLDSQEQILAYALLLGFAQQVFTGVLDRKGQALLTDLPSKESQSDRHPPSVGSVTDATTMPPGDASGTVPRRLRLPQRARVRRSASPPIVGSQQVGVTPPPDQV